MNPQLSWYLTRSSGMVAWIALVASLVLGVLLATRVLKPADRPAWLLAMHRWLAGIAIVTTALHLVTLVADSYVHFSWAELLVPGASRWKPLAVAVGVVSLYLLAAVQITSMMMRRLPRRAWKAVHLGSYALVWAVSVHAGLAGTDVTNRVYQAVALALLIAAVSATIVRVLTPARARAGARVAPR
jgi:methionine sulfoxide reductase heme-binding subunit